MAQNSNFLPLVYTLEASFNLNDFDPDYPKEPQTLGERIKKARMDKGMLIREFVEQIGVTEDTVINWERRGVDPSGRNLEKIEGFVSVKKVS